MARPFVATDEEIIAAAGRVMSRRGPDSFTLSEVAEEVGLTRTAISFRFKGARELKLKALESRVAYFSERIAALKLEVGGNSLLAIVACLGSMARDQSNLTSFMTIYQTNLADEDLRELERRRSNLLRDAVASAMPTSAAGKDIAVTAFCSHVTGTLMAWQSSDEPDGAQFLIARTKEWLRLVRIPFDDDRDGWAPPSG